MLKSINLGHIRAYHDKPTHPETHTFAYMYLAYFNNKRHRLYRIYNLPRTINCDFMCIKVIYLCRFTIITLQSLRLFTVICHCYGFSEIYRHGICYLLLNNMVRQIYTRIKPKMIAPTRGCGVTLVYNMESVDVYIFLNTQVYSARTMNCYFV